VVNRSAPTGISSRWEISDDETFSGGEPHPAPCPDADGRQHWLLTAECRFQVLGTRLSASVSPTSPSTCALLALKHGTSTTCSWPAAASSKRTRTIGRCSLGAGRYLKAADELRKELA
jgi:hypothetical protein